MHVAQVNVARLLAPLDSPQLADFVAWLEPINRLADSSPGFVWRLQTADGDATGLRPFDDDWLIINMSVWESVDALDAYVYRSGHAQVFRRRREWFERLGEAHLALWWVAVGHRPGLDEAKERLELLRTQGATDAAFTLRQRYPPPMESAA